MLALTLVFGLTPQTAFAAGDITVAIAVEKFTVNGEYIVQPTLMTVPEGSTASYTVFALLKQVYPSVSKPYQAADPNYLESVYDPACTGNWLGEFDEGSGSGWMYSVDNVFPTLGINQRVLSDGEVVRFQYTKTLGQDIGGGNSTGGGTVGTVRANKDALTKKVADISKAGNASGYGAAYATALSVLKTLGSTQASVDAALAALNGTKPAGTSSGGTTPGSGATPGVIKPGGVTSGAADKSEQDIADTTDAQYVKALQNVQGYLKSKVKNPVVGSVGGEWDVIALARGGVEDSGLYNKYLANLETYIKKYAASVDTKTGKVILHNKKYTENSRVILALSALGYNAASYKGYNLVSALTDKKQTVLQGMNGPIFALIAIDSKNYLKTRTDLRAYYLKYILDHEKADGGWSLDGSTSGIADPDISGMALQALAPYYKLSEAAYTTKFAGKGAPTHSQIVSVVTKAVAAIREGQSAGGGFVHGDQGENIESAAQVLTALSSLGYDGTTNGSFIKSVIANLLTYQLSSGGFEHIKKGGVNGMASEQAAYALAAYNRYKNGKNTLYNMSDAKKPVSKKIYKVKFNANKGKVKIKSKKVRSGTKYGKLPTPKRKGYKFKGWYTKKTGGSRIKANTKLKKLKNHTLYAHWKRKGGK
jgi:uncharacterized repeat protein (TIGR02543 family)